MEFQFIDLKSLINFLRLFKRFSVTHLSPYPSLNIYIRGREERDL